MAITFIIFIMLNIFKKEWSEFFTSDPEINKLIMSFALLFLFCSLGDASQMMLCGIMKGCALENQAVKIMFPSYK
jgi:Na+-driven multidrug efflux pump